MPKVQYSALEKLTIIQEIESGQIGVKARNRMGKEVRRWRSGGFTGWSGAKKSA